LTPSSFSVREGSSSGLEPIESSTYRAACHTKEEEEEEEEEGAKEDRPWMSEGEAHGLAPEHPFTQLQWVHRHAHPYTSHLLQLGEARRELLGHARGEPLGRDRVGRADDVPALGTHHLRRANVHGL
jgi:hypothetical protein